MSRPAAILALCCLLSVAHTAVGGGAPQNAFGDREACLNMSDIPNMLRGHTLRVAFLEEAPHVMVNEDSTGPPWKGVVADLFYELAEIMQITINETTVTRSSRAKHKSLFTACVNDVGEGHLDLCISNFWETPERRRLSSFVSPMWVDTFILQTTNEPKPPDMAQAFQPFSNDLWAALILSLVALGIGVAIVEGHWWDPKKRNAKRYRSDGLVIEPQHIGLPPFASMMIWRAFSRLFKEVWLVFINFLSGGPAEIPSTAAGRVVYLGVGWLVLISIASYTANLASFLTKQGSSRPFNTLEEAVSKSADLCTFSAVAATVKSIDGAVKLLEYDAFDEVYDTLTIGNCSGVVSSLSSLGNYHAEGKYCPVAATGEPLTAFMNSQPVNPLYAPTVSFHMSQLRNAGKITELLEQYVPKSKCGGGDDDGGSEDDQQLTFVHLASCFIIAGACLALGLLIFICESCGKVRGRNNRPPKKKRKEIDMRIKKRGGAIELDVDELTANIASETCASLRETLGQDIATVVAAEVAKQLAGLKQDLQQKSTSNGAASPVASPTRGNGNGVHSSSMVTPRPVPAVVNEPTVWINETGVVQRSVNGQWWDWAQGSPRTFGSDPNQGLC